MWAWPPPEPPRPSGGPAQVRPGTPYHRMARTWRFRWWIPPLALVAVVALILFTQVVMILAAGVFALLNGRQPTPESPLGAELPDTAFLLAVLATMTPIVMLAVRLIQWRRIGSLFSVEGRMRWGWLGTCALVAVPVLLLYFGVLFTVQLLSDPGAPFVGEFVGFERFVPALVVIVLLVPFQASAEELALRGFLMQLVGSYGRDPSEKRGSSAVSRFLRTPVLGVALSGTVFALMHDYHSWALLDVAVFGVAMAWLTWYTGGLEAAIGLHVVHNLFAFGITAWEGRLADAATGGGSWQGVVGTATEVAVFCVAVVLLARKRGVQRVVPGDPDAVPGPPERRRLPHWVMQSAPQAAPPAQEPVDGSHFQTPPPGPYRPGQTPPGGFSGPGSGIDRT